MPASPAAPTPAAQPTTAATPPKPPWRFAAERRLGRLARRLVGVAEPEIPLALSILGTDAVLRATRHDGWALACIEHAAACDDGSEAQGAWVLLAACRPTCVRRAIHGEAPERPNRHARNRPRAGARTATGVISR
jgi:hypothetical protein